MDNPNRHKLTCVVAHERFYFYFQVRYCEDIGITADGASRLFIYYGVAACVGRLVSGPLCDLEKLNTFYVYQVSELVVGTGILLITRQHLIFTWLSLL